MWHYENKPVDKLEQLPNHETLFGFCYKITNLVTGAVYIGKKQFYRYFKKTSLNKNIKSKSSRKVWILTKESDWKIYYGSSIEIKKDIQKMGHKCFHREILALACTKKMLSYLEVKLQFQNNVLEQPGYNKNIMGKFYATDLISFCQ